MEVQELTYKTIKIIIHGIQRQAFVATFDTAKLEGGSMYDVLYN
jgi:hypothetical protein